MYHFSRPTFLRTLSLCGLAALAGACARESATAPVFARSGEASAAWGPETPNFNIEVILRAPVGAAGFGHVKFRQPNDDELRINLDTWVRDLAPNTHYLLQRAVDTAVNDACTSSTWLTLGKGLVAQDIVTDERGTGREDLFRVLASPLGSEFDIHFRVIDAVTQAVVLTSDCYQFRVSQ
jgi:hypothetical protein